MMKKQNFLSLEPDSSCCPQAGCPGGKPQKTVFRGGFSRKSLEKLSNINYINWITGIEFHKLQILEVFLLDLCSFNRNVENLTTFGWNPVKISCARYWWSVYLVILRNSAFKFSIGLWAVNGEGMRKGEEWEGVCQMVLHKCFIEYPNAHQS